MFDITGTVHLRDRGLRDGRRLVMIVGVIAVPEDTYVPDEHLCAVRGSDVGLGLDLIISTDEENRIATPEMVGCRADQLLTSPLWRV